MFLIVVIAQCECFLKVDTFMILGQLLGLLHSEHISIHFQIDKTNETNYYQATFNRHHLFIKLK